MRMHRDTLVRLINRDELKGLMDGHEPFTLVETLAPAFYENSHLPGAINIPPDQVRALAPTLLPDKNAQVITYCSGPT